MVARSLAVLSASLLALVLVPAPAEAHLARAYCDPDQGQAEVWLDSYRDQFNARDPNTWVSTLVYVNTYWQGGCLLTETAPGVCFVDVHEWPKPGGCDDRHPVALPWCDDTCDIDPIWLDDIIQKDWPPKECLEVPKPGDRYECPIT